MKYLYDFIIALTCTVGFAVLFNLPRTAILNAGFAGGFSWVIFNLFHSITNSSVLSTFVASLAIAILAETFAVKFKFPATIFIVPAIVPLVPGHALYYTMLSIIQNNYSAAVRYGSETVLVSIAIAGALTVVLSVNSFRKSSRR